MIKDITENVTKEQGTIFFKKRPSSSGKIHRNEKF